MLGTKELNRIWWELREISDREATKLYRLAWRMTAHGCDLAEIEKCREEARELHMNAYPERLLDSRFANAWQYAFKF